MSRVLLAVVAFAVLAIPASAARQRANVSTTRLVPVSGVLSDFAGAALSGPQVVTFAIFEAANDGAALWTETRGRSARPLCGNWEVPCRCRWKSSTRNKLAGSKYRLGGTFLPFASESPQIRDTSNV
jgi:hypothetical protein